MEKQPGIVIQGLDHPILGKTVKAVLLDKDGAQVHTAEGHVFLFTDASSVVYVFKPMQDLRVGSETLVQLRVWLRSEYNRFLTLYAQEASSVEMVIGQVEALQRYAMRLGDFEFVSEAVATLARLRKQLPDINLLKEKELNL